jgi:hypothetical protein
MSDKNFELWCNCRTEHLEFNWFDDDDQELLISHFIDSFYAEQNGIFNIIWTRIKNAWMMLRGKQFFAFEILINKEQLQEFKDFVKEL